VKTPNLGESEPRFLEMVKIFFDQAAEKTTINQDILDLIKSCNSVYRVRLHPFFLSLSLSPFPHLVYIFLKASLSKRTMGVLRQSKDTGLSTLTIAFLAREGFVTRQTLTFKKLRLSLA